MELSLNDALPFDQLQVWQVLMLGGIYFFGFFIRGFFATLAVAVRSIYDFI